MHNLTFSFWPGYNGVCSPVQLTGEVESKREQRQRCLGVLLAMPSVSDLHSTDQQQRGPGQRSVRNYLTCWVWTFVGHSMSVSHAEDMRAFCSAFSQEGTLDTSKGRGRGSPQPCCVTQGPPWAVCWLSTKLCACSRERSVCISSKAITLIKNFTCKSWPHYTLTLSQDLGLRRGREAQHEHSANPLLLPKDYKKLETPILSFGTGVRLQPCPGNVHSHRSPVFRDTAAVRLTWQVTSVPLWVECLSPASWWGKMQFCKPLMRPFLVLKLRARHG